MDYRERYEDLNELLRLSHDGRQAQIYTGQPAKVVAVNLAKGTVDAQPLIQAAVSTPDGKVSYVTLPVVPDVPIDFPHGGGVTLTFPIAVGDECWLEHAHRHIDNWAVNGGIGPPLGSGMHELSDCVARFGPRSRPNVISNTSTVTAQLRSDDGDLIIELDIVNHAINILSNTSDINVDAIGDVNIHAGGTITATAPTFQITGNLKVTGNIDATGTIHP